MEFVTDSSLISSQHVCTPVPQISSDGSHGIFTPEVGAHFSTTAYDSPAPVHSNAQEPTVDPRARASVSDFHKFSHAFPPVRPPSTDFAITIAQPDPNESQRALMEKLAELDGGSKKPPTALIIQPPGILERLRSKWQLPQSTAQPITQIIFKPPAQQRAIETHGFLRSGTASTISYGTLPPPHDASSFKTPEREVHAYQITHLGPGMVAVQEPDLRVQPNPSQTSAVVSTASRRGITTTGTSAGGSPIMAEKDTLISTPPNADVLALFSNDGMHRQHHTPGMPYLPDSDCCTRRHQSGELILDSKPSPSPLPLSLIHI